MRRDWLNGPVRSGKSQWFAWPRGQLQGLCRHGGVLRKFLWKCYVGRKGYREGPYGFMIALCAGLYPILSYLKASLDETQ